PLNLMPACPPPLGRVKAARAAVAAAPGAEEALRREWVKAARFYARFGISETRFRQGVPAGFPEEVD
ncbi:MAG: hypothetical protein WB531_05325, partial [Thermoplasmata archaeon]